MPKEQQQQAPSKAQHPSNPQPQQSGATADDTSSANGTPKAPSTYQDWASF